MQKPGSNWTAKGYSAENVDLNGNERVLLCCYVTILSESTTSRDIAVPTTTLEVEECV
jgi:hypothetical protein